jgi:hypothetical protein
MRMHLASLTSSIATRSARHLLVVMAAACATETDRADESTEAPTMDTVFAQVLEPRCTFSSCHSAPTVAAKLDLSRERACNALVEAASCLFPQRKLVVPSDPDDSFLMHKLTGTGLSDAPTGNCSTGSNVPMPLGGKAIPKHEIDLVRSWIAAGASCASSEIDPGASSEPRPPAIASLTVDHAAPLAGQMIRVTVALDKPAPAGGQAVELQTATNALSAPVQVSVPAGKSQVTFDAYPERPTSLFTLSARSGGRSQTIQLRVAGLEVVEVLGDGGPGDPSQWIKLRNRSSLPIGLAGYRLQAGQSSYGLVSVPLTGTLPPGGCAVIGDPSPSSVASVAPVLYQTQDFTPDLPTTGPQATGYALFDTSAPPPGGPQLPLDTLLVGSHNNAHLLGPDGQIAAPACATAPAGSSARRTAAAQCAWSAPQPAQCP